jgi:WD40 repeat protein
MRSDEGFMETITTPRQPEPGRTVHGKHPEALGPSVAPEHIIIPSLAKPFPSPLFGGTFQQSREKQHDEHQQVASIAFSPDGKRIASGSEGDIWADKPGTILVWDSSSGRTILGPLKGNKNGCINALTFSRNGQKIASGVGGDVMVWDAVVGKALLPPLRGHGGDINAVTFSPDGTAVASSSRADGMIYIWNVSSGKMMHTLSDVSSPMSIAFSPDGKHFVAGNNKLMVLAWDAKTWRVVRRVQAQCTNTIDLETIVFSPDTKQLISGSTKSEICIWDTNTGQPAVGTMWGDAQRDGRGVSYLGARFLAVSSDGKSIASLLRLDEEEGSAWKCFVRVWNAKTGDQISQRISIPNSAVIAISPNGTQIAVGMYGGVRLYSFVGGVFVR